MGAMKDNTKNIVRSVGIVGGVIGAFMWGKGWTQRIIYVAVGTGVGFGIPPTYDYFYAPTQKPE
jgi:hypothetical protein